jgi:hypothetical protein
MLWGNLYWILLIFRNYLELLITIKFKLKQPSIKIHKVLDLLINN